MAAQTLRRIAPLLLALALVGCATPADGQPTAAPSTTGQPTAPEATASPTAEPSASAEPPATAVPAPPTPVDPTAGWETAQVAYGDLSWRMPPAWRLVPELDGPQDFRGLVVDGAGTPMLQYGAVANGQYATDFSPCERPSGVQVLEELPAPGIARQGAQVVAVLVPREGPTAFHAGISTHDAHEACEPGILTVDPGALPYNYVRLDIVDDAGVDVPLFESEAQAAQYLSSDEYATIREVLRSATLAER